MLRPAATRHAVVYRLEVYVIPFAHKLLVFARVSLTTINI